MRARASTPNTHAQISFRNAFQYAVLNFVDVPVEDDDAGTAESSAETFPMSHIINTAASTELFAKVAGGAAGAAGQNPARARRHAQLRAEAHARSKAHSQVLIPHDFFVCDGCKVGSSLPRHVGKWPLFGMPFPSFRPTD